MQFRRCAGRQARALSSIFLRVPVSSAFQGPRRTRRALCGYPSAPRPTHQPFVRALLRALAAQGAEPCVLTPESLWQRPRAPRFELREGLPVHRPRFPSFSAVRLPGIGSTRRWSDLAYGRAALRASAGLGPFDACFAHCLYPHGRAAAEIAARLRIPAVLSLGESSFRRYEVAYGAREMAAKATSR